MSLFQVMLQILQLMALNVDKFTAFFTLAVEASFGTTVAFKPDIFKTRRTVRIDYVFADDAFVHKPFKLPVDRCLTDCDAVFFKKFTDIVRGDMNAFFRFKILNKDIALFCFVFYMSFMQVELVVKLC